MTNRIQTLAASARDCDHDGAAAGWSGPAAAPAYPAAPAAAYPGYGAPARREWREGRWRERERAEVAAQLRALDAERDRFYAENGWRPGRARRFERYYAARRAELERRWYELQPVAWR
jgi:hypothetical protein